MRKLKITLATIAAVAIPFLTGYLTGLHRGSAPKEAPKERVVEVVQDEGPSIYSQILDLSSNVVELLNEQFPAKPPSQEYGSFVDAQSLRSDLGFDTKGLEQLISLATNEKPSMDKGLADQIIYDNTVQIIGQIEGATNGFGGSGLRLTQDGLVVTAYHVADSAISIWDNNRTNTSNKTNIFFGVKGENSIHSFDNRLYFFDEVNDLALLRLNVDEPSEALPIIINTNQPSPNDFVKIYGKISGRSFFQVGRVLEFPFEGSVMDRVQSEYTITTAQAIPGISGGSLVDGEGAYIGTVTAGITSPISATQTNTSIGPATAQPAKYLLSLLQAAHTEIDTSLQKEIDATKIPPSTDLTQYSSTDASNRLAFSFQYGAFLGRSNQHDLMLERKLVNSNDVALAQGQYEQQRTNALFRFRRLFETAQSSTSRVMIVAPDYDLLKALEPYMTNKPTLNRTNK